MKGQRFVPHATGALVAVALHALAAIALLTYEPARTALLAAAPIMVELIAPPKIEPKPEPPIEIPPPWKPPPKRRPKPAEPPPIVSAPVEAPSPMVATPPAPEPPPPPEPEPVPRASAPPAPPPPAPAVAAVTPPVFNAEYLNNPKPAYPALSRRAGEEGRVVLRVLVNAKGTADEVQVLTSSGHSRLDEAAREAVRRWRFVPAKRGEQPVAAWVLIPMLFKLEG